MRSFSTRDRCFSVTTRGSPFFFLRADGSLFCPLLSWRHISFGAHFSFLSFRQCGASPFFWWLACHVSRSGACTVFESRSGLEYRFAPALSLGCWLSTVIHCPSANNQPSTERDTRQTFTYCRQTGTHEEPLVLT
jgi:hypothetical protein